MNNLFWNPLINPFAWFFDFWRGAVDTHRIRVMERAFVPMAQVLGTVRETNEDD